MKLDHTARDSRAPKAKEELSYCEIDHAGRQLVAAFKEIEEAWKKAEVTLAHGHVPVDVKVEVGGVHWGDGEGEVHYLGFVRHKNEKRICHITHTHTFDGQDDERTEVTTRPITECSVETRLEMFEKFPLLYEECLKVVQGYVPKIHEAVQKFGNILKLLVA